MILGEWDAPGFAAAATAPNTGPFPNRTFLETWWDLEGAPGDRLLLAGDGTALIPAMSRKGVVELIGDPDVTDYHSPRGSDLAGARSHGEICRCGPVGTRQFRLGFIESTAVKDASRQDPHWYGRAKAIVL